MFIHQSKVLAFICVDLKLLYKSYLTLPVIQILSHGASGGAVELPAVPAARRSAVALRAPGQAYLELSRRKCGMITFKPFLLNSA